MLTVIEVHFVYCHMTLPFVCNTKAFGSQVILL